MLADSARMSAVPVLHAKDKVEEDGDEDETADDKWAIRLVCKYHELAIHRNPLRGALQTGQISHRGGLRTA